MHDLHIHTTRSACCGDPRMTPRTVYALAQERGYDLCCITNHLWDRAVPGASEWYAPQDLDHIREELPLPGGGRTRMLFGCEAEYVGGGRLSLSPAHYGQFDMIVIAVNHFHMVGLTRPAACQGPEAIAALFVERLKSLLAKPLPFHKVGLAHLTCGFLYPGGDPQEVLRRIPQEALRAILRDVAAAGAGIELNADCFAPGWQARGEALALYRMAKDAGCRFYCGSDAHTWEALGGMPERLMPVLDWLGLKAGDRFIPGA